ncbi:hypothetical protein IHE44_0003153 [Lamprotornis superbus]|uniref:Uncharacterized protein n=1 Tax=Lamprotornis superbus TaxID=245042 RepID=A0A835TT43_9PASS|nr:hypothetical protein IHE44_0003153 [Lamprotornis superbus]
MERAAAAAAGPAVEGGGVSRRAVRAGGAAAAGTGSRQPSAETLDRGGWLRREPAVVKVSYSVCWQCRCLLGRG